MAAAQLEIAPLPAPEGSGDESSARRRRRSGSRLLGLVVILVFGLTVLAPIVLLIVSSFNTAPPGSRPSYGLQNWKAAFATPGIQEVIWNTLSLGVVRTGIATVAAIAIAWLIARTTMPGSRAIELLFGIAFFVPPLALTLGWKVLLDADSGVINTLLRDWWPFGELTDGPLNINSFWGIVWVGLTASSIPFQVLLITPVFRRMGSALEDAATMCGARRFTTIRRILIPITMPAILGSAMLSFIWNLKAFEVELILGTPIGLNVYSTQVYLWVTTFPPAYGIATALGSAFIVIMLLLAWLYQRTVRGKDFTTISAHTYSNAPVQLGRGARVVAPLACWLFITVAVFLPVGAVVLGSLMTRFGFFELDQPYTLAHWQGVLGDQLFISAFENTLFLGVAATLIGVLVYFVIANITVRSTLPGRGVVDIFAWLPVAVPGVLLGLGLLWVYLELPFMQALYGTLAGLTVAVVISHMATGTQQMRGALTQVNRDHELVARVCGAGPVRTNLRILLPLIAPSVAATALLTFVAAVRDISSVVLLSGHASRPLSVLMLEYTAGGDVEQAAALGLLLTALMAVAALLAFWLGRGGELGSRTKGRVRNRSSGGRK